IPRQRDRGHEQRRQNDGLVEVHLFSRVRWVTDSSHGRRTLKETRRRRCGDDRAKRVMQAKSTTGRRTPPSSSRRSTLHPSRRRSHFGEPARRLVLQGVGARPLDAYVRVPEDEAMNKDELKGKAERLKGRIKEASGVLTGNKEKRAEGMGEQITGTAREKLGE